MLGPETKLVDQFDANERCCGCRRFFPADTGQWVQNKQWDVGKGAGTNDLTRRWSS